MSEGDESDDGDSPMTSVEVLLTVADSLLALDLLRKAEDKEDDINWYTLSHTSFYLGVIGLMIWSVYVAAVVVLSWISSAGGLFASGSRVVGIWPIAPAAAFIFFFSVSRYFKVLEDRVWGNKKSASRSGRWTLLVVSLSALIAAAIMRAAMYLAASSILETNPLRIELIGLMLVDGGYVSLLLVGFGGLGAFYFDPK